MISTTKTTTSLRRPITPIRRGVATIWMILVIPVVLTMLVVVVEIGSLWLAQIEATNAMDAAALGGVQSWQSSPSDTTSARNRALELAFANTVNGQSVVLNPNSGGGGANDNLSTSGNVLLGAVGTESGVLTFDSDQSPTVLNGYQFGVHIQATVPVAGVFSKLFGLTASSYSVTRSSTAIVGQDGTNPRVISGNAFVYGTLP